ncbi:phosphatase PAP2 family protein [Clostridium sp. MB40-C1]|uniref:phosphatase PAP2 family protein n=1 Tax=Clostridium sp. MB40-C1 TaxID=3070996 RepID=UPI0027DFC675|nr:phosphatase PAP2 family protein [Clostridium sp. MB40-C1]WMJ79591.1 phosphatase PAP2 family protein [Clostridium sp. MB40-C1]
MESIKKFIGNNRHFLYMIIWIPLLGFFYCCQKFVTPKYIMHSSIDDHIPFLKVFILPYVFWYFYISAPFVYFGLKSKDDFLKLTKFIFLGMGISYIIYVILPSGQNLRPILLEKDIFTKMVGVIYAIDPPANVCPSIHVIDAVGVNIVICSSPLFEKNRRVKVISTIIMVLICLSTMFIKQHSFLDVIAGIALSIGLYGYVYLVPGLKKKKQDTSSTSEI